MKAPKKQFRNTKKGQTARALAHPSVSKSNWFKRTQSPDKVIKNDDGTVSTHRMAYTQVGDPDAKRKNRQYVAYPTIREQPDGTLKQLGDKEAVDAVFDKSNRDGAVFNKERHAKYFSKKGYKKATGMLKKMKNLYKKGLKAKKKMKESMKQDSLQYLQERRYSQGLSMASGITEGIGGLVSTHGAIKGGSGQEDTEKVGAAIVGAGSLLGGFDDMMKTGGSSELMAKYGLYRKGKKTKKT